jgi:hypothetical protein
MENVKPKTLAEATRLLQNAYAQIDTLKAGTSANHTQTPPPQRHRLPSELTDIPSVEAQLAIEKDPKMRFRLAARLTELREANPFANETDVLALEDRQKIETDPVLKSHLATRLLQLRGCRAVTA